MRYYLLTFSTILCFLVFGISNLFAIEKTYNEDDLMDLCLNLKQNEFKNLHPVEIRFAHIYLNTLLDYIVENNQDLIKERGFENHKFCVLVNTKKQPSALSRSPGLILFNIFELLASFNHSDSNIVPTLSHELAHLFLNHYSVTRNLTYVLKGQFELASIKDKSIDNFQVYLEKHPLYINLRKAHEIEADELGLKIYLNAKFVPMNYAKHYLNIHEASMNNTLLKDPEFMQNVMSKLSKKDQLFFKYTSTMAGCLTAGLAANQNPLRLASFMNKIKYIPNYDDEHPTGCWRYWNLFEKIKQQPKDSLINNTITSTLYITLDLNKNKYLNNITTAMREHNSKELSTNYRNMLKDLVSNYDASETKYAIDTISRPYSLDFDTETNIWTCEFYDLFIKRILLRMFKDK